MKNFGQRCLCVKFRVPQNRTEHGHDHAARVGRSEAHVTTSTKGEKVPAPHHRISPVPQETLRAKLIRLRKERLVPLRMPQGTNEHGAFADLGISESERLLYEPMKLYNWWVESFYFVNEGCRLGELFKR